MFARLWWKESRQFWPVWLFVAAAAAGTQWLATRVGGRDVREGALGVAAAGWAALYGCAAAATAFAGERETGTLRLLDAMPVGRPRLWAAKASFALVTTLGLGAVLLISADAGTERWGLPGGVVSVWFVAATVGALLLEVVGWGLFWSSFCGNALTAAALTVCSTLLLDPALWGLSFFDYSRTFDPVSWRLGLAAAAAGGSVWRVAGRELWGLLTTPVVRATPPPTSGTFTTPDRLAAAGVTGVDRVRDQGVAAPPRAYWPAALRVLVWQTSREAFPLWWKLAAAGIGVWLYRSFLTNQLDPVVTVLVYLAVGLFAGVSVCGAETRGRTERFLAVRGVRPGLVWSIKLAVWAVGVALIWAAPLLLGQRLGDRVVTVFAAGLGAFAVALLCGQTIRRGITALAASLAVFVLLILPIGIVLQAGLLAETWTLAIPLALLAVGGLWSRDWLLAPPGPGRWVRLGAMLAAASAGLFLAYAGSRVYGVPELNEALATRLALSPESDPATDPEDAAGLYREADRLIQTGRVDDPALLDLLRRASALPRARFGRLDRMTLFHGVDLPLNFERMTAALADSADGRRARGDLAGAWADVLSLLRVGRNLGGRVPLAQANLALTAERRALNLALVWAAAPGQTPEALRAALKSLRELPPAPDPTEAVRAEARIAMNTLDLPPDALAADLVNTFGKSNADASLWNTTTVLTSTTRWELARARRVFPLAFASALVDAGREPYQRLQNEREWRDVAGAGGRTVSADELQEVWRSTPIARLCFPSFAAWTQSTDRNEVLRRAVVQILALRAWQLAHEGRLPENLAELVPTELDRLPADPYSNRPFGYVVSEGQDAPPLGASEGEWPSVARGRFVPTEPGRRLLYSVGPDRRDDGAWAASRTAPAFVGDLIFPLPPAKGEYRPAGHAAGPDDRPRIDTDDKAIVPAPGVDGRSVVPAPGVDPKFVVPTPGPGMAAGMVPGPPAGGNAAPAAPPPTPAPK